MKKTVKLLSFIFVLSLGILLLYQCATNPVTGKKELMLISEKAEISLGKNVDQGIRAEYGIYDNAQLNAYVAGIGQKLTSLTHRPNLQYHFAVLDTPVENAFAAPGGYIYITRGLLAMMNSEAELAAILGHELGHVNARHSARSLSRTILLTVGLVVASELSKTVKKIAPIASIATQLLFLKYSRKDEYQADSLGVEYSSKAGYQAGEMIGFFNSIRRLSEEKGGGHLPNFLSTHPLTTRRIERVRELTNAPGYPSANLAVEKTPYLRKINGLVYGNDPRQGYVEGNAFYHPTMRFYFNIPPNWKVENTPKQVTLTSPDKNALLMLTAGATTKNLNDHVTEQLKNLAKFNVIDEGFSNINGMRAFYKFVKTAVENDSEAENEKENINVRYTSIKKGNNVINFLAAAPVNYYSTHQNEMLNSIGSFQHLTDMKYIRRRPKRVVLRQVGNKQVLSNFLPALHVPQELWKRIALLNGIQLDTQLSPRQLIKIIE